MGSGKDINISGGNGKDAGETPRRHLSSAERQAVYRENAEGRAGTEAAKKRKKRIMTVLLAAAAAVLVIAAAVGAAKLEKNVWEPARRYRKAEDLYSATEYLAAYEIYISLGNYRDCPGKADSCILENARKVTGRTEVTVGDSRTMPWFGIDGDGVISFDKDLYKGGEHVVIPDVFDGKAVRAIADKAFFWAEFMTSVEIPASVTKIGERSFFSCTGLVSVTIPDSVAEIGESAFADCVRLEEVRFGSGLRKLTVRAFKGCYSLKSADLPEGLTAIESRTFIGCLSMTELRLPSTVTSIGNSAIAGCDSLKKIVFAGSKAKLESMLASSQENALPEECEIEAAQP